MQVKVNAFLKIMYVYTTHTHIRTYIYIYMMYILITGLWPLLAWFPSYKVGVVNQVFTIF